MSTRSAAQAAAMITGASAALVAAAAGLVMVYAITAERTLRSWSEATDA